MQFNQRNFKILGLDKNNLLTSTQREKKRLKNWVFSLLENKRLGWISRHSELHTDQD